MIAFSLLKAFLGVLWTLSTQCGSPDQQRQHRPYLAHACWKCPGFDSSQGLGSRTLLDLGLQVILLCTRVREGLIQSRSRASPCSGSSLQVDKCVCHWFFSIPVLLSGPSSEDSYMHCHSFSNLPNSKVPTRFFLEWMKLWVSLALSHRPPFLFNTTYHCVCL